MGTELCKLLTKSGKPCPFNDLGRGLCHIHDPDQAFARQHPKSRAKLLARHDVQAVLASASLVHERAHHCSTCACLAPTPHTIAG
jgi:hypothetical protein